MRFKFIRWGENKKYALFKIDNMYAAIPFSRLIPNPVCEAYYRQYYSDPNKIAEKCAEESSVFGPAVFHHFEHLLLRYGNTLIREKSKEYMFPATIDFTCVREKVLKGYGVDEAIRMCS